MIYAALWLAAALFVGGFVLSILVIIFVGLTAPAPPRRIDVVKHRRQMDAWGARTGKEYAEWLKRQQGRR